MEKRTSPSKIHPGWTLILIAVFLLVLTLILILTHRVPVGTLITALLPILALTLVGLHGLRSRSPKGPHTHQEETMELPHYENLNVVPEHLTTRAGLKQRGLQTHRPEPAATVTSYGKTVFLYDLRALDGRQPQHQERPDAAPPARPRKRIQTQE